VAITSFQTDGFRRAAFDAGFDGYLTKPIDFTQLNKLIQMLLPAEEVTNDLPGDETTELSHEATTELTRHS
jgi:DNA-binding NarL/FixJ family response regulator